MKILHISDTHLGYSAYSKLDPEININQRELDVYSVFERFVDYAVENKPDLILHAGDLFDSVRPSNRAIANCLEQLLRLSRAQIPVVLISGNHESPRLRETGSVFRLLEHLEHIYPVYRGKYEQVTPEEVPDVIIHALPHAGTEELLQSNLEAFAPVNDAKFNIGLMHAAVEGLKFYHTAEFNEQIIPSGYLKPKFDYIALGHYHEFCQVEPNAYYAGSPERFSFNEAHHQSKGFIELGLEKDGPKVNFVELQSRPMLDLPPVDCSALQGTSVTDAIVSSVESALPAGKILRLKVENLPTGDYHTLDFNKIRKVSKEAVHFEQVYNVQHESVVLLHGESPMINKLSIEFSEFIKGFPVEKLDKSRLEKMGLEYIYYEEG